MQTIISTFNNRELVLIILFIAFIGFALAKKDVRTSLFSAIAFTVKNKLMFVFIIMAIYVFSVIYLLSVASIWNLGFLKDTIYWYFGVAIVMIVNSTKASQNTDYFKNTVADNLKMIIILEFILNLYCFHFIIELFFTPILIIVVLLYTYAETDKKYSPAKKLLHIILSIIGILLLIHAIKNIVTDIISITNFNTLIGFLLPIFLTFSLLPFIYGFALIMVYENIFVRMKFFNDDKIYYKYATRKIFSHFHFKLGDLINFYKSENIVRIANKEDINNLLNNY